jgi:hypothetical protein
MFQRQYEDDADVLAGDRVLARGYARLELFAEDGVERWNGTFRITEPDDPPDLTGSQTLRLRDGSASEAQFEPADDLNANDEEAGRAGTFLTVTGVGPCPF